MKLKYTLLILITSLLLMVSCIAEKSEPTPTSYKIGMITDSGTIDDKSFNQITWKGIEDIASTYQVETTYLRPVSSSEIDLLKEVANLKDAGYNIIVTPGVKFETAIHTAQEIYPDMYFIMIEGVPHNGDSKPNLQANTVSITFSEQESGFLVGYATALELQDANLGFIGGMKLPSVQKFLAGYIQGITYANETQGTHCTIESANQVFLDTFSDVTAGLQVSAIMYDRGVDAIFTAAGNAGNGVIQEAKSRSIQGDKKWVIGVDMDQYEAGLYSEEESVILTSAVKHIDKAVFVHIERILHGTWQGARIAHFNTTNNGIGLPEENPNLSWVTLKKVAQLYKDITQGEITVSDDTAN